MLIAKAPDDKAESYDVFKMSGTVFNFPTPSIFILMMAMMMMAMLGMMMSMW